MKDARSTLRVLVVLLAAVALAGCATGPETPGSNHDRDDHRAEGRRADDRAPNSPHENDRHSDVSGNQDRQDNHADHAAEDHHDERTAGRLLVATNRGTVAVLDALDGSVEAVFAQALPGGLVATHAGPSGQFGYVVHRDVSTVLIVDSGQILTEHDGHEDLDLGPPAILGEVRSGRKPSRFTSMDGRVGFYNDESGNVTMIDEGTLRDGLTYRVVPALVDSGTPILLSDRLIVGYVDKPFAEVIDYTGRVQHTIPNVRRARGQARVGRYSAIGTDEGVLVVTQTGDRFDARMVRNPPGTPDGVRTETIAGHPTLPHFVGDLGSALVRVDPVAGTSAAYRPPSAPWRFDIDRSGRYVVVLGEDGVLSVLDSQTFALLRSVKAVAALDPGAPVGTTLPAIALGRRVAYVTVPSTSRILAICLDEAEIVAELHVDLGGRITSLALMVTDGMIHEAGET